MKRLKNKFTQLKKIHQSAFVAYICAGDPDYHTSLNILEKLPSCGVDIIEIGMPFLDPSGDGPIIENASKTAIANGMNLNKALRMASQLRLKDHETPLVLMSYFNPILKFGLDKVFFEAEKSGFDAVLIVDLPLEEEHEIIKNIKLANLDFIRLIAPSTDENRLKKILKNASGFIYLISMFGITGTKSAIAKDNIENIAKIRKNSQLPLVIGFGIQQPAQAQEFSALDIDGVVIGSSIVKEIFEIKQSQSSIDNILEVVKNFSRKIKSKL